MDGALVTIGIPAWNRRDALCAVLDDIVAQGVHLLPQVEVMVIDDHSPDGSYAAALRFNGVGNIRVLQNAERQGFRGNFCQVIEQARTEYVLISCDDDFVLADGVHGLLDYLARANPPPALISSLFYDKGEVYRANAEEVRPIPLGEYRHCCAHMPGIVFNARLAKAIVPRIRGFLLDPRNAYPQCCVALLMLLLGYPGVYLPTELVRTGYDLASGIDGYATVAQRWEQFTFFDDLLVHLRQSIGEPAIADLAGRLLEHHRSTLFYTLGTGVSYEKPALTAAYLRGAADYVRRNGD